MNRRSRSPHRILPVITLAVLAAVLTPVRAFAVEPTFAFTGRGWGHGIGMSQYGAKGMADAGKKHGEILKHFYQGTSLGTVSVGRDIRVALQASNSPMSSWVIKTPSHAMAVSWPGGSTTIANSTGVSYTFTASGSNIVMKKGSTVVLTKPSPVTIRDSVKGGLLEVVSATGPWNRANVLYRGKGRIVAGTGNHAGKVLLFNDLPMEDYLKGVVPRESPSSWHIEALKAQAVAARSYAYRSLRSTSSSQFDVYCTVASQVYGGYGHRTSDGLIRDETDRTNTAIVGTVNLMVKYGSTVVQTFFFSTSGGHTENIENVWTGSSPQPYFKGVPDPYEPASAGSHIWKDVDYVTGPTLRNKLLSASITPPKVIRDVLITRRGVSGRVMRIVLKGASGDDVTLEGSTKIAAFRRAFGWGDTWFYATSFRWVDSSGSMIDKMTIPSGFAAPVRVRVTPAITGRIDGVVITRPGGVESKTSVSVKDGVGTLSVPNVTGTTTVKVDSARSSTDRRGTGGYFRSPTITISVTPSKTTRIQGKDRYGTAVAVSKAAFPSTSAEVVLSAGEASAAADVLSASGLAGSFSAGAPVLLTPGKGLPSSVSGEISRLQAKRVWIVGGEAAVSPAVVSALRSMPQFSADPGAIKRLGGSNRYATARIVAEQAKANQGTAWSSNRRVLLVNGASLADACAAAPLAYNKRMPVLLVKASSLSQETSAALVSLAPTKVLVVGGSGVVSDGVMAQAHQSPSLSASSSSVTRVAAGVDRYDTAAKLASYEVANEGFSWSTPHVANGAAFTDAIVAGPLAGKKRSPMLFMKRDSVPSPTAAALKARKTSITKVTVLGGIGVISEAGRLALELLLL